MSIAAFLAEQCLLCSGASGSEQRIVKGFTQTGCVMASKRQDPGKTIWVGM